MPSLCFLWHLHQPDYRLPGGGGGILPWVRLHAARGYNDLLSILRRYPALRSCVNFSGILLEQLGAAAQGETDSYAALTARPAGSLDAQEREFVVRRFFSANAATLIRPHRRYWELFSRRQYAMETEGREDLSSLFSDEELADLLVWFNLAWIGFEGQRRPDVRALMMQGQSFRHADQLAVLRAQQEILAGLIPAYSELAREGLAELSFTPHFHPILPLVCDLRGQGRRDDADPLPDFRHPEDAAEQIRRGAAAFEAAFGFRAGGVWPAEGSVSDETLGFLAAEGLSWAATDQQNLPQSHVPTAHGTPWLWQQYGREIAVFFRDTRLADNIGFDYSSWNAAQASRHLIEMVLGLARQVNHPHPVVTIALDGENPWEHYPGGGEPFLSALGERLAATADLDCRTPSEAVQRLRSDGGLPGLGSVKAGSWIGGNFDIWSRHPETRSAWRRLAQAREDLAAVASPRVTELLLKAEGSDSFWWYGDDFVSDSNEQFDLLFRSNLIAAYEAAGRPVPPDLYEPICAAYRVAAVEEPGGLISPVLDGRVSSYFEWLGSVAIPLWTGQGSMAKSSGQVLREFRFGFSEDELCIRLDLNGHWKENWQERGGQVHVCLVQGAVDVCVPYNIPLGFAPGPLSSRLGLDSILELAVPIDELELARDAMAYFWLELCAPGIEPARFPSSGRVAIRIIPRNFGKRAWVV